MPEKILVVDDEESTVTMTKMILENEGFQVITAYSGEESIKKAEAEKRRAMAVAREQEMQALVQENQAKVVMAEAEVPLAMAEAFRKGNLGIMDYYKMKNINADTTMRDSIANPKKKE